MSEILIVRHTEAMWPIDRITPNGESMANSLQERFAGYERVVCSPLKRSQQTAQALGYTEFMIDPRSMEFEKDTQASSAEHYIQIVHVEHAKSLYEYGDRLLQAIRDHGEKRNRVLFIAHTAVMSAAYFSLSQTGEILHFNNLEGFSVVVNGCSIKNLKKFNLK